MYYHVEMHDASGKKYWHANISKDIVILNAVLPYVNGQIVSWGFRGRKILLNMKTVNQLKIFKSQVKLYSNEKGRYDFLNNNACKLCVDEIMKDVRIMQARPEVTSLIQKALSPPDDSVFVVMKFGDKMLDSAYEGVMRPV